MRSNYPENPDSSKSVAHFSYGEGQVCCPVWRTRNYPHLRHGSVCAQSVPGTPNRSAPAPLEQNAKSQKSHNQAVSPTLPQLAKTACQTLRKGLYLVGLAALS